MNIDKSSTNNLECFRQKWHQKQNKSWCCNCKIRFMNVVTISWWNGIWSNRHNINQHWIFVIHTIILEWYSLKQIKSALFSKLAIKSVNVSFIKMLQPFSFVWSSPHWSKQIRVKTLGYLSLRGISWNFIGNEARITSYIHAKQWDIITYRCPHFNGVEVRARISSFIPQKTIVVVIHPCVNPSWTM